MTLFAVRPASLKSHTLTAHRHGTQLNKAPHVVLKLLDDLFPKTVFYILVFQDLFLLVRPKFHL